MAQRIALTNDARSTFRTNLGSQPVRVTVWWQPLDSSWYLTLARTDRTVIIAGARLDEGARPLDGQATTFIGALLVNGVGDVGRNAWTTTHELLYLTPDEAADHLKRRAANSILTKGYPDPPCSISATAGNERAILNFCPGNTFGEDINEWQYRVRRVGGSFGDWITIPGSGPATMSYTVGNLMNMTMYEIEVRVVTDGGWSKPSNAVRVVPMA